MSYVSISDNLLYNTRCIIESMQRAEVSKLAEVNLDLDSNSPFVQRLIWGEHAHLKALVPESWLASARAFDVRYNYEHVSDSGVHTDDYLQLTIQLEQSIPVPRDITDSNHRRIVSELDADIPPNFKAWMDDRAERRVINNRWSKVQSDVKSFLKSCKSLNEGLKLWPQLAMYIQKSYLDVVAHKPAKAKSAESGAAAMLAGIDTNALVGAAVIARISGHTN